MANKLQEGKICSTETMPAMKTYILQFIYKDGNGWAFVNANTPNQAQSIFLVQTKYEGAKVTNIKETKWQGEHVQLVYEGAVTTFTNIDIKIDLDKLIQDGSIYRTFEEYIQNKLNLDNYCTKEELQDALDNLNIEDLDLSDYYTKSETYSKSEVNQKIRENVPSIRIDSRGYWVINDITTTVKARGEDGKDGKDGKDGEDGITPTITMNPTTFEWIINGTPTGVIAKGKDGTMSFEELTPEQRESLKGADGRSISNITTYFAIGTSNSTPPSVWGTTPQQPTSVNKYLWSYIKITFDSGDPYESPKVVIGNYAKDGQSGPGGGSANIAVVDDMSDVVDDNTLYFFDNSLLQGVGLYNTLLKEGSIVGNDGVTYTYSPTNLYKIHSDGSFSVLENDPNAGQFVDFTGNDVYYNYYDNGNLVRTNAHMKRNGHIVCKTIKYADMSDTAYLDMFLAGPFFEATTPVTITYDSSKIALFESKYYGKVRWSKNGKKFKEGDPNVDNNQVIGSTTNNTIMMPDYEEIPIPNNSTIIYTNSNFFKAKNLVVKRVYNEDTELLTGFDTVITFTTPAEVVQTTIRFNDTTIFYKKGYLYNNNNTKNEQASVPVAYYSNSTVLARCNLRFGGDDNYLFLSGYNATYKIRRDYPLDRNTKYVFYAKVANRPRINLLRLGGDWKEWAKYTGKLITAYYTTGSKDNTRSFGNYTEFLASQDYYGTPSLQCRLFECHYEDGDINHYEVNGCNTINVDLCLDQVNNGDIQLIEEIGLMVLKNPFDDYDS